ncbi:tetratricopeptide repeat protein [Actinoplanes sp. NBRC 103695]|uniref:tetratricopeptide repeat protein n=1 Tax=Actinoplanes sp. NBRC 103695 TaxID=3032202 RepID=UPI003322AC51
MPRHRLAVALRDRGRLEEAEAEFRAVPAAQTALLGAEHPNTLQHLAVVMQELGRFEQAEAKTALRGAEHPDTLRTRRSLVRRDRDHGRADSWETAPSGTGAESHDVRDESVSGRG